MAPKIIKPSLFTKPLTPMTNLVTGGSGLSPSRSWKIISNLGTMKMRRKVMMPKAIVITMPG